MTRTTLPLLLLVGLTACKFGWSDTGDDEQDAVQTRSFDYDVSSIILSDNGAVGVMSTSEGVVAFDSWTGDGQGATAPGDFTEANVEDWYDDRVLIVDRDADAGVFIWEPGVVGYEMHEDEESDANASITRSFSGGIAWVGRRAENCLVFRDGIATASIEACGYIRDMAVIDSDGTLFLGYDDDAGTTALLRLDPDGSLTDLEAPMYRLAWDDTTRVLYAVDDGATQVQALTSDGGPVFSLDFDDPVVDLAVLEREAKLAVLTVSGAEGLVHIFDQYTGEKLVDLDAGSSAHTLAASLDGDTMAWAQSDRLIISTVDWDELLAGEDTGD